MNTQIRVLEKGLLPAHNSLLSLNLSSNPTDKIKPGFFENAYSLDSKSQTVLIFRDNFIEEWTPSFTSGLEKLKRLDLSGLRSEKEINLSNLNSLEELNLTGARVKLNLKSSDFPQLKKLTISRNNGEPIRMQGMWPQLEYLELSFYANSTLPQNATFDFFPNLRFLDLSANSFIGQLIKDDVKKSGFSNLKYLEHVRLMDTSFFTSTGSEALSPLLGELPQSVRLIEVCTQRTTDNIIFAKASLFKLMKERPYLKVRTKIKCFLNEDWVDVVL